MIYCCVEHGYQEDAEALRLHRVARKARYERLKQLLFNRSLTRFSEARKKGPSSLVLMVRAANGVAWRRLMARANREIWRLA